MANSLRAITLIVLTTASFGYAQLCTDAQGCNEINPITGEAVLTPDICNTITGIINIKAMCPGRCGVTCCDFDASCAGVDGDDANGACQNAFVSARCPKSCRNCENNPTTLVDQMAADADCADFVITKVETNTGPGNPPEVAGFRCCFDRISQVCNDPQAACDADCAAETTFQGAELICKLRGGHICTVAETTLDCCVSHRCEAECGAVDLWLGSSQSVAAATTVAPTVAPTATIAPTVAPIPTVAPTVAATVAPTGCRDKYPAQCARVSQYPNFGRLCGADGAYARLCKKSCNRC